MWSYSVQEAAGQYTKKFIYADRIGTHATSTPVCQAEEVRGCPGGALYTLYTGLHGAEIERFHRSRETGCPAIHMAPSVPEDKQSWDGGRMGYSERVVSSGAAPASRGRHFRRRASLRRGFRVAVGGDCRVGQVGCV